MTFLMRKKAGNSPANRQTGEQASGLASSQKAENSLIPGNSPTVWLVVGLGNPGAAYAATRHNAGFLALDGLAAELGTSNWRARFGSLVAERRLAQTLESPGETLLVLAKPQTMMNLSGGAVKGLLKHYKATPESLIVIHDDIDLPTETLRIKSGGGHGGHNGLRNIVAAIGPDFMRIRIGVGAPPGRMDSAAYVLQPLKGSAYDELAASASRATEAALVLMRKGLIAAQNSFN